MKRKPARVGLLVLGILIGLFLAWRTLVLPTIESQARDAAIEPFTKQASQLGDLQRIVDGINQRFPGGQTPGPGTGSSAVGTPFDGRLSANVAKTTNPDAISPAIYYPLKSGESIRITDLFLQNPQGDAGSLFIYREKSILLQVRMENFRDLDYHFITPFIFSAGDRRLGIGVTCTQPGPGQDRCTPAISFTGTKLQLPN